MRQAGNAARGVALVNALVVVAALAAISAALLLRAERAVERQRLGSAVDQVSAYLDAGQAQALVELRAVIEAQTDASITPGQGWDRARDVEIDRGRVGWTFDDLQGRFNLGWLTDEGEWGELARAAFLRLAEGEGVSPALAGRLVRAAGPDTVGRAAAFGAPRAPDLPLVLPSQLAAVARPADGGAAALGPLWPLLAALPPNARLNPDTAPLPVLQALIPGLDAEDWALFEAGRLAGAIRGPEGVITHAFEYWPEGAAEMVTRLPLDMGSNWFELRLTASLDTLTLRRSAVVALTDPDNPAQIEPRAVLSLPIVE